MENSMLYVPQAYKYSRISGLTSLLHSRSSFMGGCENSSSVIKSLTFTAVVKVSCIFKYFFRLQSRIGFT